jgi:toxin ParE1/3/4
VRLDYAPRFFARLRAIEAYIAEHDPPAARRTVRRIREAAGRLRETPGLGRPGRVPGTRDLIVGGTSYLVPYRVRDDRVEIISVFHAAQRWPDSFD